MTVYSPRNILIVGTFAGKVVIYDAFSGIVNSCFDHAHIEPITALCYDPKNRTLYTASEDRTIKVWDVGNQKLITILPTNVDVPYNSYVTDLQIAGNLLFSSLREKYVLIWNLRTVPSNDGGNNFIASVIHPNISTSKMMASLSINSSHSYNNEGNPVGSSIAPTAVSNSNYTTSSSSSIMMPNISYMGKFGPHPMSISNIRCLEGTVVVSSGEMITIWDITTLEKMNSFHCSQCQITCLEVTSEKIFTAGTDECARIWPYKTKMILTIRKAVQSRIPSLDLSHFQLMQFPLLSLYCKWITLLDLSFNGLRILPSAICELINLKEINLQGNLLESLPSTMNCLIHLDTLNLSHNNLYSLSLVIGSLTHLIKLDISHNFLTFLPPFLAELPLQKLDITNNTTLQDPKYSFIIKQGGTSAILKHLKEKSSSLPIHVRRAKLMIVGNENVGKTSLVINLRHKSKLFNTRPSIKTISTQGITIDSFKQDYNLLPSSSQHTLDINSNNINTTNMVGNERRKIVNVGLNSSGSGDSSTDKRLKVKWEIWDFAGQEIYYNTHQFFITPYSLYVIVWDLEKGFKENNIDFWLRCIRARTTIIEDSHTYCETKSMPSYVMVPVLLVATHLDAWKGTPKELESKFRAIKHKFIKEFPNIHIVTGVSCKNGKGISELKATLKNVAQSNPSLYRQLEAVVPAKFFYLEKMIHMARSTNFIPFLSWSQFQLFARGCINDHHELLEATKLLANLGTLVYLPRTKKKSFITNLLASIHDSNIANSMVIQPVGTGDQNENDLVVLDPQWLVDLFSTLLGSCPSFVKNGLLRGTDFPLIWRDPKFPESFHQEIIQILEYFEILFPIRMHEKILSDNTIQQTNSISGTNSLRHTGTASDKKPCLILQALPQVKNSPLRNAMSSIRSISNNISTHLTLSEDLGMNHHIDNYLVPTLLPSKKQPMDILWPAYEECLQLNRFFHFQFLPIALFSRFLVRLLSIFPSYYCWRHGLILSEKTRRSYAFVEENPEQKLVSISVRGSLKSVSLLLIWIVDIWIKLQSEMYSISFQATTLCYQCVIEKKENPHVFTMKSCEQLIITGERFVMCEKEGHSIRLDQLCPELCLLNLKRLELDPTELQPWDCDKGKHDGVIGEGGFGYVYRKKWRGQLVAVKKLKQLKIDDMTSEDYARIVTSFRHEVWLMAGISHPNIVKILGFSLGRDSLMVMEYIEGGDLFRVLTRRQKGLTWPLLLRIAYDIACGMLALHSLNPPLCHSDLKCPNCMIASFDENAPVVAKVTDFGLSSRIYGNHLTTASTKNPFWTAPEILSEMPFDVSCDSYSFGVILWNLLTRKALFEEMLPWTDDVSRAVRAGKRPPIPKDPSIPSDYTKLIKECWSHEPRKRPGFAEISSRLENIIQTKFPNLYDTRIRPMVSSLSTMRMQINGAKQGDRHGQARGGIPSAHVTHSSSIGSSYYKSNYGDMPDHLGPSVESNIVSSYDHHHYPNHHKQKPYKFQDDQGRHVIKSMNFGNSLIKRIPLGMPATLFLNVGLAQVWVYVPKLRVVHVINAMCGIISKSFNLDQCLTWIEFTTANGFGGQVWTGSPNGLCIWDIDLATLIKKIHFSLPTGNPAGLISTAGSGSTSINGKCTDMVENTLFDHPTTNMIGSGVSRISIISKDGFRRLIVLGMSDIPQLQIWCPRHHKLLKSINLDTSEYRPLPESPADLCHYNSNNETPVDSEITHSNIIDQFPSILLSKATYNYDHWAEPKTKGKGLNSGEKKRNGISALVVTDTHLWCACGPYVFRFDIWTHLSTTTGGDSHPNGTNSAMKDKKGSKMAISNHLQPYFRHPLLECFEQKPFCFQAHSGSVTNMVHTQTGNIWTSGIDEMLRIWNNSDVEMVAIVPEYPVSQMLVIDELQIWISCFNSQVIHVWNSETYQVMRTIDTNHTKPINSMLQVFNKTLWTASEDSFIHVFN